MNLQFRRSNWALSIIALAFACCAILCGSNAIAQTAVWTNNGYVSGYATALNRGFLGIPYAAAPVGNLRWKAPQAAAPWFPWIRPAVTTGSKCPQLLAGIPVSVNEDCLNLNVIAPLAGANLPVMVFIHGGAFTTGAGSDYDPSVLSYQGNAIVVTINYRLGAFGFLAHPALTAEAADHASGQYGLQDQQFALNWVKNNIAYFGGNPGNVTVFGESAGAISVCAQLASPKAAGLFHKAIIESGSCNKIIPVPLAASESAGAEFAGAIGCTSAACLRNQSTLALLYNPPTIPSPIGKGWSPNYGGVNSVVPVLPRDAISAGAFNRVPVINGSNHDEWRLFTGIKELSQGYPLTTAQYTDEIIAQLGATKGALALAQYPVANYPAANVAHATLMGDYAFICGNRATDQQLSAYVPTYAYEFNDPTAPPLLVDPYLPMLAAHASELQYIFRPVLTTLNLYQQDLSSQMMRYWTNFARTGNPNGAGLPAWPAYTTAGDMIQRFALGNVGPITTFAADHKCGFWASQGFY